MKNDLAVFEGHEIRRLYDEKTEAWFFSIVDIIRMLTQPPDYKAAQNYRKVLKHLLNKEESQLVTNCHRLKLPAADGKNYLPDVANAYPGKLGVVAEGALADLLLVDGDPLSNLELVTDPAKNFVVIMKDGNIYKNLIP